MAHTVLLTGATGFIGSRLAARLHARGDRLRCVVRSAERARWLETALGAELVVADVTDAAALASALAGCDRAYHLAAIYDVGVVDAAALERTNVEGTRSFLSAVERAGTARAIHVSTTVALGPARGALESDSIEAYAGPYPSSYHRTKAAAHRLAREAQQRGLPILIACPAFVYGPADRGPAGRFIVDLIRRRVPALLSDPAWFSFVHVDDVAHGLELLSDRGETGVTYVFSGEAMTMNDFARKVAAAAGVRAPVLRVPAVLAELSGRALDLVTRATGWSFPITREGVATTARQRWLHSRARTERDLGWSPRSVAAGLPETVAWARSASQAP